MVRAPLWIVQNKCTILCDICKSLYTTLLLLPNSKWVYLTHWTVKAIACMISHHCLKRQWYCMLCRELRLQRNGQVLPRGKVSRLLGIFFMRSVYFLFSWTFVRSHSKLSGFVAFKNEDVRNWLTTLQMNAFFIYILKSQYHSADHSTVKINVVLGTYIIF